MKSARSERRSQRGAAMVEAVVLLLPFCVALAGIEFTRELYSKKMAAMRQARVLVWKDALAACKASTSRATRTGGATVLDETGQSGNPDLAGVDQYGTPATKRASNRTTVESVETMGMVRMISKESVKVGATYRLECNEEPEDGSIAGMAGNAFSKHK